MPRGRPRQFDMDKALDQAMLLFWRHGYEGTSLASLADAMQLSMPSVYAAFGSKQGLFQQALDRYLQRPASYLPTAMAQPTALQAVQELFKGAINMVMHKRHPSGCLLVQGALAAGPDTAGIQQALAMRRKGAQEHIKKRFELAIAMDDLPAKANAEQLARYIATILWGMSVQAAGGATRKELEQIAQLAVNTWQLMIGQLLNGQSPVDQSAGQPPAVIKSKPILPKKIVSTGRKKSPSRRKIKSM